VSDVLLEARDLVVVHSASAGLRRDAAAVRALDGASLSVSRGEVVAVVGASGAGKSTLARAVLGLERPVAGSVAWSTSRGGTPVDLSTMRPSGIRALRPRFQPVFQDPAASLDPRWSARATLVEALRRRASSSGDEGRAVVDLLARVGLEPAHLDRLPHAMSGGEKQRLCLARALATDPELLVLDEPVAALDASVQAQVLDLLQDLRRERELAYLIVTHDLALVAWIADRVLVLAHGRIVEEGTPEQVLQAPRHPATAELVAARRALEAPSRAG
jgi:peptide/nickel transport system ATP-binding protein